jgi:hypothetical protein
VRRRTACQESDTLRVGPRTPGARPIPRAERSARCGAGALSSQLLHTRAPDDAGRNCCLRCCLDVIAGPRKLTMWKVIVANAGGRA